MTMRGVALGIGALLFLSGCADGTPSGLGSLLPLGTRAEQPPLDLSTGKQDTLYLGIVDGLSKQGRYSAALAFLDGYSGSGAETSSRYWLLRGNALLGLHRNKEAAGAFAELRTTPLAAHGWNGLGRIAADDKDWPSADADFREAVHGEPTNADFLNNLAFANLNLDRADSATAWLQQAHELAPGSERILTNLAIALTLKGDHARADTILLSIKDGAHREAVRTLVNNAVSALTREGQPS